MANNPRIIYDPGTGAINVNLPRPLSSLPGDGRRPRRTMLETWGGIVPVHFQHAQDEYELVIEKMPLGEAAVQTFVDDMISAWAWIGKGGIFHVAFDRDDVVNTTLNGAHSSGVTTILVPSTSGISSGQRLELHSASGGWKRERVVVTTPIVLNTSFDISYPSSGIRFAFADGDAVRSVRYWRNCVIFQEREPILELENNLIQFRLKFQTSNLIVTP